MWKAAERHWDKALVVALPFLVALTNATWLTSAMADIDSWTYNGYYKALRAFAANRAAWGPANYFETRLPVIVPGALVHGALPDALARGVWNLCILHTSIALSFWYVVRTHLSRTAATLATLMLASDVFYLRTIGWDYVDNAALAYQALTFALLTRAPRAKRPRLCLAAAGFTAASMVAAHMSAMVMLPVLGAYALYTSYAAAPFSSRADVARRAVRLAAWSAVGAAGCLLFYGLVSRLLLAGPFLFFLEQLRTAGHIDTGHYSAKPRILGYGYWLALHGAVLVASAGALLLHRLRPRVWPLSPFARFWLWTTCALYTLLVLGDALKRTIYMARSGLYATNFLLVLYLAVAVLLFDGRRVPRWLGSLVFAVFPAALMTKLALHDGLGLSVRFPQPMFVIALAMAAALLVGFAFRRASIGAVAALALAGCSLLLPRKFERDDTIIAARNFILANAAPPRVYYADDDPQGLAFVSVASALTDHVVHDHHQGAARRPLEVGDHVAVLESRSAQGIAQGAAPCAIEGLASTGDRVVPGRYFDTVIHLFDATRAGVPHSAVRCGLDVRPDTQLVPRGRFTGAELPGKTGERAGDARIAREGTSVARYLTEGPHIALPAGVYEVTFHYTATTSQNGWELVVEEDGEPRRLAVALLPATSNEPSTFSVPFRLPAPVTNLEARAAFAGRGALQVLAVTIAEQRPQ